MGLTGLLDDPLYSGGPVNPLVPGTMPVSLNGQEFAIEPKLYSRKTLSALRQAQDNASTPGESSLSTETYWLRNQTIMRFGAGQAIYDSEVGKFSDASLAERQRFYMSKDIDWSDDEGVRITTSDVTLDSMNALNVCGYTDGVFTDTYFVVLPDRLTQYRYTAATDTWTTVTFGTVLDGSIGYFTGPCIGISNAGWATIGTAAASQIYTGGSPWTVYSTYGAVNHSTIGLANGRLIAAGDAGGNGTANVWEVKSDGSRTMLLTGAKDFLPQFVTASPNYIYVGGGSSIYKTSVDSSGALIQMSQASSFPPSEYVRSLLYYAGGFIIGTVQGFRFATADSNGNLSYGPLIEPGAAYGIQALAGYRDRVLFGWLSANAKWSTLPELTGTSGIGMIFPGRTTASAVPAWGSLSHSGGGGGGGIPAIQAGTFTAVVCEYGYHIRRHNLDRSVHPTLTSGQTLQGLFDTGWITYGLDELKVYIDLFIRHTPLLTGESIRVFQQQEDGVRVLIGTSDRVGSSQPEQPFSCGPITSRRVRFIYELNMSTTTSQFGPMLRSWTLRGYPTPSRADVIVIPIILTEIVEGMPDERMDTFLNGLEVYRKIRELIGSGQVVDYTEGAQTMAVQVKSAEIKPIKWQLDPDGNHRFFEGHLLVEVFTL